METVIIKRPALYGLIGGLADFFNLNAPRKQFAAQRRFDSGMPRAQNLDAGNLFGSATRRKNAATRGGKKPKKPKEVQLFKPTEKNIYDVNVDDVWAHDMGREQGILRPRTQNTQNTYNREPIDYDY